MSVRQHHAHSLLGMWKLFGDSQFRLAKDLLSIYRLMIKDIDLMVRDRYKSLEGRDAESCLILKMISSLDH